jgi:hypothetical protein
MGLRPTQGDENRLKGTAFRPSINTAFTVALATEGNIFDRAKRSGGTCGSADHSWKCFSTSVAK